VKSTKLKAKCSRCGRVFRADKQGDLLSLIRKHMWKEHADWMRGRIKSGLRKRKKSLAYGNPDIASLSRALAKMVAGGKAEGRTTTAIAGGQIRAELSRHGINISQERAEDVYHGLIPVFGASSLLAPLIRERVS